MTVEEKKLWYDYLKQLSFRVYRQKVIGCYIVDFYIPSKKIVIEIDGTQHFQDEGQTVDAIRDEYLKKLGISVLRYSNLEINTKFKNVCEDLENKLGLSK